jgi:hypothetical protein
MSQVKLASARYFGRPCQTEARRAQWDQVNRLVGLSRFKLGLSVRKTPILVEFVYARQVSISAWPWPTEDWVGSEEATPQRAELGQRFYLASTLAKMVPSDYLNTE